MGKYRKLGRRSDQRKALLRTQVTQLLYHGKIVTTEARAKEIRKIAEKLITMAVYEKDNFDEVVIKAKVPRKDANGKRIKEVVDGKRKTVFDEIDKTIKKDRPSRLHARRQMLKVFYPVTSSWRKRPDGKMVTSNKRRDKKKVDMAARMFDEVAPRYVGRNGGYTRIIRLGQRKGDGAMQVIIELV